MAIANSRKLRWWSLAVAPPFVLTVYLSMWQRGDLAVFATLALSDRLPDVLDGAGRLAFFYAFAAAAAIVPPLLLVRQRRVRWETIGRTVAVEWGSIFAPKSLAFDRHELRAVLTTTDQHAGDPFPGGGGLLVLEHASLDGEAMLARARTAGQLLPLFEALAEFLPGSHDATLVPVACDGHGTLMVSRSAASRGGAYCRLQFRGDRVAEFRAAIGYYLVIAIFAFFFGAIVTVLGCACGWAVLHSTMKTAIGALRVLLFWELTLLLLSGGLLVLALCCVALLTAPRALIDLDRGEFYSRHWPLNPRRLRRRVSLADVAGLQICVLDYDTKASRQMYELNLVLREPAGERITLLDAYGRKKIDHLAQRLGAFLSVPVRDHAGTVARDSW